MDPDGGEATRGERRGVRRAREETEGEKERSLAGKRGGTREISGGSEREGAGARRRADPGVESGRTREKERQQEREKARGGVHGGGSETLAYVF